MGVTSTDIKIKIVIWQKLTTSRKSLPTYLCLASFIHINVQSHSKTMLPCTTTFLPGNEYSVSIRLRSPHNHLNMNLAVKSYNLFLSPSNSLLPISPLSIVSSPPLNHNLSLSLTLLFPLSWPPSPKLLIKEHLYCTQSSHNLQMKYHPFSSLTISQLLYS